MIDQEEAVMEIIVNAGQSRSLCFEALRAARQVKSNRPGFCCTRRIPSPDRRIKCKHG